MPFSSSNDFNCCKEEVCGVESKDENDTVSVASPTC